MTLSCSRRTAPDMTTHYCAGAAAAATCLALAMLAACANGGQAQQVAVLPLAGVSLRPTNSSTALALFTPRRRRRYVRFPAHTASDAVVAPGSGRLTYPHNPRPPPVSHTGYNSWVPVRHKQPHYQVSAPTAGGHYTRVPQMGQRSPRLVFRDPDVPGTIRASSPFYTQQTPNGLQDITADDSREGRAPGGGFPVLGDQSLCATGSCEFFLFCWMSAGLLEGSCGGFLYACCQRRSAKDTAKKGEHDASVLVDYGPVTNDPRCGVSIGKLGPSLGAQRRIVGGDEAGFGSFPWQAYIRIGSSRCGGSLVNRYHVVTAGHCVARASARQVQVTLGDYVINSAVEPLPAYTFGVREIRVHPYFKFTPQADRFDVAVLRLDRPVQYMPHIAPICLPEKNEDFLGQYGWAAGWGALQAGSRLRPKTLQAVDVPVIDNRLCERWHKSNGINVVIYEEMMCAGYRGGGKDSCQGDSGGPLMMEKAGRWYLIGIVSAGYSCAQRGQPGIYHRVAHTVDWISYIVNST
ncbi:brain-specific serine protease 4 isoform X1 [Periplaneta americana]|uniref:brain-specific serine protease 4 isoform X1 n=1 Tax=Periplaneta americana TaxID=6978 RepID=UPI0037E827C3